MLYTGTARLVAVTQAIRHAYPCSEYTLALTALYIQQKCENQV